MTNNNSMENWGEAINKALNNMDFNQISEKIKTSVENAIQSTIGLLDTKINKANIMQTRNPKVCAQRLPENSKASGFKFLSIMIGLIGLAGFPIFLEAISRYDFIQLIIGGVILASSGIFSQFFWKKSKFIQLIGKNYKRFLRELGHNTVIPIRDLASAVQQSEEDTIKDLIYMMQNGYFLQARIVENDSLFLLDIPTFKLYKNQSTRLDNKEEKEITESKNNSKAKIIIENGKKELDFIEKNKISIKNGVFLEKVNTVSKTIENILSIIQKYPDKAYALDKFMDYYLPTTRKLIDTYIEFEQMNTGDEKILSSMKEIDKSVETINQAFEKIQVELLSDRAMDIKTDIDTMRLLLNQEGLLKEDWSKK